MRNSFLAVLTGGLAMLAAITTADAQASRTWVSGVGDDVNPCSRTAPCKTFAGAISKTAANGEINIIDPGGFGALTITKPISIIAEGGTGGILASLVNGIIVNTAGAGDKVILKGLDIEGFSNGLRGINIIKAGTVVIEDCNIRNFRSASPTGIGIDVQSSVATRVYVKDTTIIGNRIGINVKNSTVDNFVFIEDSMLADNIEASVQSDGSTARAFINRSVIRGATNDLNKLNAGRIFSFYTSHVGTGTPTNATPLDFK